MSTSGGAATTCATDSATSSGRRFQSFASPDPKCVATEPGITTETRTPASRTSSISDSVNAITAHFVAA